MPLSEKQNEFIRNANSRWNLKIGAVRSGKTFVDVDYVIPARLRAVHGQPGLNVILGVSRETIERNVLQPMREKFTERLIGSINNRNVARICGEDVYCLGAEKISQVAKIQGMSIKYAYGDEMAKWNPEVFAMLQSRLDREYSCFDGSCNPEYPSHWLKAFVDRDDIDAYVQKYTIFDNPFLPKEFIDNLCREYEGTVYYKRYILGEWTLAEGLIYPMYEDALLTADFRDLRDEFTEYALSIDYGTQNAFSAGLWGKYDGVWYRFDEYYYSGRDTGIQKTDEEYGADVDTLTEQIPLGYGQKLKTIIDPSAASFIAVLRKKGRYKVLKADNAVEDGIRETATALKTGKIKIYPCCKAWRKEAGSYAWDSSQVKDTPIKINDHAMDDTRYFVKTMRISRPRRNY